jgi:hypothetical protein
LKCVKVKERVS